MKEERIVAGLACSQVLERLSEYLDHELTPEARAQVEAHLRGCDRCARFGGELRATVRALREHLLASTEVPQSVQDRLQAALAGAPEPGSKRS